MAKRAAWVLGWVALWSAAGAVHAQATGRNGYSVLRVGGADTVGADVALARVAPGQHLALVRFEGAREAWVASCDDNQRCDARHRLDAPGPDPGHFPSLVPRPAGGPFGAFADAEAGTLVAVACASPDCASATLTTIDADAPAVTGTAVAIDPLSGFPAIAYGAGSPGELRFLRCANADCTSASLVRVDRSPNVGANPSLAFDADGSVLVVHDDVERGELRVALAAPGSATFRNDAAGPGRDGALLAHGGGVSLFFTGADRSLVHRRCEAFACNLGLDGVLSPPDLGATPSAGLGGDGRPVVAHRNAATGAVYVSRCTDADCSAAERLVVDDRPDAGRGVALVFDGGGRARAYWPSKTRGALQVARCLGASCAAASTPAIALNGPGATLDALATRADGAPVVVFRNGAFERRLALCSTPRCDAVQVRALPSDRGTTAAALAIRADGRPLAYYARFGGTLAYDCADPACSTGTERPIGANDDTATGQVAALVRPDGRPILVRVRRLAGGALQWRAFDCADAACAGGTDRLLASEPAGAVFAQGLPVRAVVGADGRPTVLYAIGSSGESTTQLRHVRCDDPGCAGATLTDLGTVPYADAPIALRADGRLALRENRFPSAVLATCGDLACTPAGVARVTLPLPVGFASSMLLDAGDRPQFDRALDGESGIDRCTDATCTSARYVGLIGDAEPPERVFLGQLAGDPLGRPVVAWTERTLADVWLGLPPPDPVFSNGFEP